MIRGSLPDPPGPAGAKTELGGGELATYLAQRGLDGDEGVDHVRIELPFSLLENLGVRSAPAHSAVIGPMARHGIESVRDGEDTRAELNLLPNEAVGIPAPIPAFVVQAHDPEALSFEE